MKQRLTTGALSLSPKVIFKQLRSQPAVVISIFVATALGAFLLGAAPRSLERASVADLRAVVTETSPALRNIRVEWRTRIGAGPDEDPLATVRKAGDDFAEREFPDSVLRVISDRYSIVDTGRFKVMPLPGESPPHPFDTYLRFRFQDGARERVRIIEGDEPRPRDPIQILVGQGCPADREEIQDLIETLTNDPSGLEEAECELEEVPHFEVLVSETTEEAMGVGIGQTMLLSPDRIDPFYFGLDSQALDFRLAVSISGIITLDDASDDYWFGDGSLHTPRIQQNADLRIIYATGLAANSDLGPMIRSLGHVDTGQTWRYVVSADLIAGSDARQLQADLDAVQAEHSTVGARLDRPVVASRLPELLSDHQDQMRRSISMLSTAAAGLTSMVIAVVLLLTLLMTERQRSAIVLIRSRGSSGGQIGLTRLYEAVLIIVPASLVGYLASGLTFGGTAGLASSRLTVALAVLATTVLVAAAMPVAHAHLGHLLRRTSQRPLRAGGRRAVFDVALVTLASGALALLRRRGDAEDVGSQIDLLLAITPVLVGVAAGLVAIRIIPPLARAASFAASRSRGVVPLIGIRRALQQSSTELLPIMVIVLCVAITSFALLSRTTVTRGQVAASWQKVGADYSIRNFGENAALPSAIDLTGNQAIKAFAFGTVFSNARVYSGPFSARVTVLAIDSFSYSEVAARAPDDLSFPVGFDEPVSSSIGEPEAAIPAIVSKLWPPGLKIEAGDLLRLDLGRAQPTVAVAELRQSYPDLASSSPFVVVDRGLLEQFSDLPTQPTVAYVRASEDAAPSLRETLSQQSNLTTATSRFETLREVTADPLVNWLQEVFGLVAIFALVLAGVTIVSALALGSSRRSRDLAYLRTMGLTARQSLGVAVIEQFPPLLLSGLVGLLAGLGTGIALGSSLDFRSFTGGSAPVLVQFDPIAAGAGVMALLVLLAAAVGIFVIAFREQELHAMLRLGEEP